ncbi:MAG: ABC transporter ATP-binding protein [Desulfonauticus sp.]|nr:ABC transporter ATP-binding protein [Desulfonauticus sp.]
MTIQAIIFHYLEMLSVQNLRVKFTSPKVEVLRGVNLQIHAQNRVALVGESGCGKSLLALSILGLLPAGAQITGGSIYFYQTDLAQLSEQEYIGLRGKQIGLIFQDPMTALNPVFTAGEQVAEVLRYHLKLSSSKAKREVLNLFQKIGFREPKRIYHSYPHELSGGMRQRVLIALAVCCKPKLLIADEPTTALDVTTQAQVIKLLTSIQQEQKSALLFISHDLSLVSGFCTYIYVMYLGEIVEQGVLGTVLNNPLHPYTQGLIASIPLIDQDKNLRPIPGFIPPLDELPLGCVFHPRCAQKIPICEKQVPPYIKKSSSQSVRCWLYN